MTSLSRQLLLAYAATAAACVLFVGLPLRKMLARGHISRAIQSFESQVDRHRAALRTAAEAGDRLALDRLCDLLNRDFNGRVTLLAPSGEILGDSIEGRCARQAEPKCLEAIRGHGNAGGRAIRHPGRDTVAVQIPITLGAEGPVYARLLLPLGPIRSELDEFENRLFAGGIAAVALAVAVGFFLARRIARPLAEMTGLAEQIAAGDLEYSIRIPGRNEIARLAEALNHMRLELRRMLEALTRERNQAWAIIRSLGEGVLAMDHRGRLLLANRAAQQLLNISIPSLEQRATRVYLEDVSLPPPVRNALENVLETGKTVHVEYGNPEHGERVYRISAYPVSASTTRPGRVEGAVLLIRDMTEAWRAQNMGRQLVANASHELRTPIAVILSTTETLRAELENGVMPAVAAEFLDIILRQVRRMQRLIDETLELCRLDEAGTRLEFEPVDLAAVIQDAARLTAAQRKQRGQTLELPPRTPPVKISGVQKFLLEAFCNVLDNASRYAPEGSAIQVSIAEESGWIVIRVDDQGPGIPPAEREILFDRFVRGKHGERLYPEGTGLGLAIVRQAMQVHGGRAAAGEAPGGGARIILRFPREKNEVPAGSKFKGPKETQTRPGSRSP